jgi:PPK2 family polyphosphate:nucleotide phosphotransferase
MQLERAGKDLDLGAIDTSSTPGFTGDKDDAEGELEAHAHELDELQEMLFAESRKGGTRKVLLVLQAMDTAGKGGIVRHVVGSMDPQGVKIHGFKAPTDEEKKHDFLWRVRPQLPPPGIVGVFDRSHYEEVLIGRVRAFNDAETVERYYGVIMDFEKELIAGGTKIIKVMLHISPAEQKERLAERLERADKYWKFNPGDIDERKLWPDYMEAYQLAIRRTSTAEAPWYVVPADRKWYARLAVQRLLLEALRSFDLQWPKADFDVEAEQKRLAAT